MFDTVADRGTLRVLVNNASYRPRQRVQTITEDDWHQVRSVTLDGAFRCIRYALPALIPGGRIVNILGRNALAGDPERVHLSAAKHGLLGLTLALAAALRDDGVAVNAVSPGVDTDVTEAWTGAAPKSLPQVARLAFADAAELTGTVVRVDCDGSVVSAAHGVVSASIASTSPPSRSEKAASASLSARSRPSTPSASPWNFSLQLVVGQPVAGCAARVIDPGLHRLTVVGERGRAGLRVRDIGIRDDLDPRHQRADVRARDGGVGELGLARPAVQQRDGTRERHRELALQTRSGIGLSGQLEHQRVHAQP